MSQTHSIKTANPDNENVIMILNELYLYFQERFGSNGKNSFIDWENNNSKLSFENQIKNLEGSQFYKN